LRGDEAKLAVTGQLFPDDRDAALDDFYACDAPKFVSAWSPEATSN